MRRCESPPAAQPMRIIAVVVTHDRLAQLRLTVTRLLAEDLDRVIVVDNASADGTGDWLGSLPDPRLEVLTLPQNRGGAGGFAAGLARAQAHDPDWTVVMDDDARPMPGTIGAFRALEPAGWDALAAAVHLPSGAVAEMNRPARNPFAHPGLFLATLLGGSVRYHVRDCDYPTDRTLPVDMVSFVGLFLSRRALRRAGLPDAALFIYGDDVLYALRLRAAGLAVGFEPRLRFIHDCKTLQGDAGIYRPLWKSFYHHRNLVFVLRAAAGRWLFPPLLGCLALRWITRARHYRAQERRIYLALLRLALADGLRSRTDRPHAEIRRRAGEPAPQVVPHADAGLTRPLPPVDRPNEKGRDAA